MSESQEIFISYSHDSVEHVEQVLALSNRLRLEGVDCVLDQYETSPPEGWPRWMEKKIRVAKFVVLICTEPYFKRVMGEEEEGKGLGVQWEGNIIFQHLYNASSMNSKFIPVLLDETDARFIPVPLQGTTRYHLATDAGYEDLYRRLTDQPKVRKPKLGRRKALPKKAVKTNPAMFLSSPIDVDLWNAAKWRATFFISEAGKPPLLGLAYEDEASALQIFAEWRGRYGSNDEYEELRVAIIEGDIEGEEPGYSVHIGPDPDAAMRRFKDAGYAYDEDDLHIFVSRINRMNPPPKSKNLEAFKMLYRRHRSYVLAPGFISEDRKVLKPFPQMGILKGKIIFRHAAEIGSNDIDSVVLGTGQVERPATNWRP